MQNFYDVLYKHWEKALKELRAVKKAQDSSAGKGEVEVIEIPDDDLPEGGSIEELEAKSLEDAEKGIVIYGGITDDGYSAWDPVDEDLDSGLGGNSEPAPVPSESPAPQPESRAPRADQKEELIRHFVGKRFFLDFCH